MSEAYVIAVDGLEARPYETLSRDLRLNMARALNKGADRARTAGARRIEAQVGFPAGYLNPSQGRLVVRGKATRDDLEATISARVRPTSLARFAVGGTVGGRTGVEVAVEPGLAKLMKRAFLIRLKAGNADLETKNNLGLAIRLKPGERVMNKRVMKQIKGNLYVLYGPSVSQVFQTVREDISPDIADFIGEEVIRLMGLDI
ncbi:hypothetical protein [Sphingomonas sp. TREG-RG-20F-R18-01]|uniref:hypothetical protein n=1 Tax=Sphingomonas sp. TREG-RG-20F-R18-01 TaxID=2914982 RepID=UPI001F589329|nr:hypothetical protein [Sphingomonas sp. TREG-RG-20F-R18-01]